MLPQTPAAESLGLVSQSGCLVPIEPWPLLWLLLRVPYHCGLSRAFVGCRARWLLPPRHWWAVHDRRSGGHIEQRPIAGPMWMGEGFARPHKPDRPPLWWGGRAVQSALGPCTIQRRSGNRTCRLGAFRMPFRPRQSAGRPPFRPKKMAVGRGCLKSGHILLFGTITSEKISYRKLSYFVGSHNHRSKGSPNQPIFCNFTGQEVSDGTQAKDHGADCPEQSGGLQTGPDPHEPRRLEGPADAGGGARYHLERVGHRGL